MDISQIGGTASIAPGRNLDIDLVIAFEAPRELTALVFSFNPAMRISSLALGDVETSFSHRHGLLTVQLAEPMAAKTTGLLSMRASGVPDPGFAYPTARSIHGANRPATSSRRWDVESPLVSVVVSNRTDGDIVIADAIRWLEVARGD